jgi:hypothetical protein
MNTKHISIFVIVGLLLGFTTSQAQQWSKEQKEVLEHIKGCWTGRIEAFKTKDFNAWANVCNSDEDIAYWPTSEASPMLGFEADKRAINMGLYMLLWKRWEWLDVRPINIKIDNDVALVHFYAFWIVEDYAGKTSMVEQKRFEVFRKKNGDWILLGGMVTPVPQDD